MALPQARPEDRPRKNCEHFQYWSIGKGSKHHAYIAGPCQWLWCHPSERTKPCLRWLTEGAMTCKLCGSKRDVTMIGYQPVYRGEDWAPRIVVVFEPELQWVEQLAYPQRVIVGRESDRGSQVWVRLAPTQEPRFTSTLPLRQRPADITEALLMLWNVPGLAEWYRRRGPASDNGLSVGERVPHAEPVAPAEPEPADEPRGYTAPTAADVRDEYDAIINRVKEHATRLPSKNGKHPPKG